MSESFQTQAIHAGYDPLANGRASVPPIYASAAFDLGDAARGDALAGGDIDGFEDARVANPTVDALERRLAALEGGIGAVAVGSGMAAVSYALMCAGEGGGRIIAPTDLYGASVDALGDFLPQFGIHTDFVKDINDLKEVESKIGPDTRAIFAETVANPSTAILDIEPLAKLAHSHGIALIVDNTVPTPYRAFHHQRHHRPRQRHRRRNHRRWQLRLGERPIPAIHRTPTGHQQRPRRRMAQFR